MAHQGSCPKPWAGGGRCSTLLCRLPARTTPSREVSWGGPGPAWQCGGAFQVWTAGAQAWQEVQGAHRPARVLPLQGGWANLWHGWESQCCGRKSLPDPFGEPGTFPHPLWWWNWDSVTGEGPDDPAHGGKEQLWLGTWHCYLEAQLGLPPPAHSLFPASSLGPMQCREYNEQVRGRGHSCQRSLSYVLLIG